MDNDLEFADLENELRALAPRAPAPRLAERVAAQLESPPRSMAGGVEARVIEPPRRYVSATTWTSWKWANWAVAAALVAVLVSLNAVQRSRSATAPDPSNPMLAASAAAEAAYRPVAARRALVGSEPEAVVELPDGSVVRRVRDFYVDTIVWRSPQADAEITWEVPGESVRFVGLAAY